MRKVSKGTGLNCGYYPQVGLPFLLIRCESGRVGRELGNAARIVRLLQSVIYFRNVRDDDLSVLSGEFDITVGDVGG